MATVASTGLSEDRSLELHLSLPHGSQEYKYLGHHLLLLMVHQQEELDQKQLAMIQNQHSNMGCGHSKQQLTALGYSIHPASFSLPSSESLIE